MLSPRFPGTLERSSALQDASLLLVLWDALCPCTLTSQPDITQWWWLVDPQKLTMKKPSDQIHSLQERSLISMMVSRFCLPSLSSSSANLSLSVKWADGLHGGRNPNTNQEWWRILSIFFASWSSSSSLWDIRDIISVQSPRKLTRHNRHLNKWKCHQCQLRNKILKFQKEECSKSQKSTATHGTPKTTVITLPLTAPGALQLTLSTKRIAIGLIMLKLFQKMFTRAPKLQIHSSLLHPHKMRNHHLKISKTNTWKILKIKE